MEELIFYMDETGNRLPDKKPDRGRENRDWFGFGGYLIAREDKDDARAKFALGEVEDIKAMGIKYSCFDPKT